MAATNYSKLLKKDSKNYITTALLQLLETHDFNDLKVSQVVKKAGVSRMAFYRNFDSLEQVLTQYFEDKIGNAFMMVKSDISTAEKQAWMLDFFEKYTGLIKLSIRCNFEYIIRKVFDQQMIEFYRDTLKDVDMDVAQRNYWANFMSSGVYAIWREWVIKDQREPLSEVHKLIGILQNSTLQALTRL
ncbi:TetR/AcrR family transcriptional regulator [Pediococcus acidilactici]